MKGTELSKRWFVLYAAIIYILCIWYIWSIDGYSGRRIIFTFVSLSLVSFALEVGWIKTEGLNYGRFIMLFLPAMVLLTGGEPIFFLGSIVYIGVMIYIGFQKNINVKQYKEYYFTFIVPYVVGAFIGFFIEPNDHFWYRITYIGIISIISHMILRYNRGRKEDEVCSYCKVKQEHDMHVHKMKENIAKLHQGNIDKEQEIYQIQKKLHRNISEFYIIKEVSNYIGTTLEVNSLMDMITDMLMGILGVHTCSIVMEDQDNGTAWIKTIYDNKVKKELKKKLDIHFLDSFLKNQDLYLDNQVVEGKYPFLSGRKVGSFICVALKNQQDISGYFLAEHELMHFFSEDSVDFFAAIANQINVAINNAKLYEKVEELARRDGLTNAFNRLYIENKYKALTEWALKNDKSLGVVIFDIDHFKKVNDTYGHIFGDEVLKTIVKIAKSVIEPFGGTIGRYGGEEFIILIQNKTLAEIYTLIEKLRKKVADYEYRFKEEKVHITSSFGISAYPEICAIPEDLIRVADEAMYLSKKSGRNKVTIAN